VGLFSKEKISKRGKSEEKRISGEADDKQANNIYI